MKRLFVVCLLICVIRGNHYKTLGVKRDSDIKTIKKAYHKLALKYHPDKNQDNAKEAETKFIQINKAYEVISNKKLRKHYDLTGQDASASNMNQGANFNSKMKNRFSNINNNMFKTTNKKAGYSKTFSFSFR